MSIPEIKTIGARKHLFLNGRPYRILGGEVHNSSSSSLDYMREKVWPAVRPLNLNTLVAPVFWECVEPEEGVFNFDLVKGLIDGARKENMHLVFLWFGLWKNGESTYIPAYVKRDYNRYFRVRDKFGKPLRIISPLCEAAVSADAGAFKKLMEFIKIYDENENTVLMMQVENEMGVLGAERDFSPFADSVFNAEIPDAVSNDFKVKGNWRQAFGSEADEKFMAYYYASAADSIARAGKSAYPIPMYVNAWLQQFPWVPGSYPSGGPVAKESAMWKCAAPNVDFLAPDIYVDYFGDVADEYSGASSALAIPEVRNTIDSVPFLFYAVGAHNAMCFSPFAIEDLFMAGAEKPDPAVLARLNISEEAFSSGEKAGRYLAKAYSIISGMEDIINDSFLQGRIHGFLEHGDNGTFIRLKEYELKITWHGSQMGFSMPVKKPGDPLAGGFVIELDDDNFIFAGTGFNVEVLPKLGETAAVDVIKKEEGVFINNVWKPGRILNGDEGYLIMLDAEPQVQRVEVYKFR